MTKMRQLIGAAVLLSAGLSPALVRAEAGPRAGLLQAVRALRSQEMAVRNIRVSATCVFNGQIYDPSTRRFVWCPKPMNRYVLTAIFDGLPRGLFRADVSKEWAVGPYGHLGRASVDSFLTAYNGRVGTYLQTAASSLGTTKLFAYNHGRISGEMPDERSTVDEATGWAYCVFGFNADVPSARHPRFSAYISPGRRGVSVTALRKQWMGKTYLQVTRIGPPLGKDVFLLDPREGFAIARCDHYGYRPIHKPGGGVSLVPMRRVEWWFHAVGFFEPKPGIFYPRDIVLMDVDPLTGAKRLSIHIRVSKVVVNDPHISPSTYVVKFPRGSLVKDQATGRYLQVGGTPAQQLKEIEAAVKAAR